MNAEKFWVRRQSGMALIVSLIILLSMTLLGLAAIQNTTMQERMAGNVRAENIAFQAAEAALRAGEANIAAFVARPEPGGDLLGYEQGPCSCLDWTPAQWASARALDTPLTFLADGGDSLSVVPRYVLQEAESLEESGSLVVGQQRDIVTRLMQYRVIARGTDASGRSEVLLLSKFARRF